MIAAKRMQLRMQRKQLCAALAQGFSEQRGIGVTHRASVMYEHGRRLKGCWVLLGIHHDQ
jgi:hypothetical protein